MEVIRPEGREPKGREPALGGVKRYGKDVHTRSRRPESRFKRQSLPEMMGEGDVTKTIDNEEPKPPRCWRRVHELSIEGRT